MQWVLIVINLINWSDVDPDATIFEEVNISPEAMVFDTKELCHSHLMEVAKMLHNSSLKYLTINGEDHLMLQVENKAKMQCSYTVPPKLKGR